MAKTRTESTAGVASPAAASQGTVDSTLSGFFGVFRYSRQALGLVLSTSRRLTLALAVLTVIAGTVPAGIALGSQLVDAVVTVIRQAMGMPTGCCTSSCWKACWWRCWRPPSADCRCVSRCSARSWVSV